MRVAHKNSSYSLNAARFSQKGLDDTPDLKRREPELRGNENGNYAPGARKPLRRP